MKRDDLDSGTPKRGSPYHFDKRNQYATHEMAFARDVAKHVIFMGDGVIVEEGTSHQIFEDPQKEQTKEFLSRFRNS